MTVDPKMLPYRRIRMLENALRPFSKLTLDEQPTWEDIQRARKVLGLHYDTNVIPKDEE